MKIWIITLPFLCSVGVTMAQGIEKEGSADQPQAAATPAERAAAQMTPTVIQAESIAMPDEPVAVAVEPAATPDKARAPAKTKAPTKSKAPAKARSKSRMGKRGSRSMPTGDMRHCLDMKTRAEIIRCAETRPKK